MQKMNWKVVVEVVGMAAIVASLIFVGLQIRQDQRVAKAQVNLSILEAAVAIDSSRTEHADVWVKARNLQELSESEKEIVERIIVMAEYRVFFEVISRNQVDNERGDNGLGSEFINTTRGSMMSFSIMLFENPGARQIWNERSAREEAHFEKLGRSETLRVFRNAIRKNLDTLDR